MKKKRNKNYILGVDKRNFSIYLGFLIAGSLFIILSFYSEESNRCGLSGSLGTGLIGAILLAWSIDRANNIRAAEKRAYIKTREIGSVFLNVKELVRLLYKEYILVRNLKIVEGTEIRVCEAIEEMEVFYNKSDTTNMINDLHFVILNLKTKISDIIEKITEEKRYFLDNDILTEDELAGLERLNCFLFAGEDKAYDFNLYKIIINSTYSELKKINDFYFKIYKNNGLAIFSPKEMKTSSKDKS